MVKVNVTKRVTVVNCTMVLVAVVVETPVTVVSTGKGRVVVAKEVLMMVDVLRGIVKTDVE